MSDLLILLWLGAIVYLGYPPTEHLRAWIMLVPAVALLWISFLMPTRCGYMTRPGKRCECAVRGQLRGCRNHDRRKRDAMLATVRARNPGRHVRVMPEPPGTRPRSTGSHRWRPRRSDPDS